MQNVTPSNKATVYIQLCFGIPNNSLSTIYIQTKILHYLLWQEQAEISAPVVSERLGILHSIFYSHSLPVTANIQQNVVM